MLPSAPPVTGAAGKRQSRGRGTAFDKVSADHEALLFGATAAWFAAADSRHRAIDSVINERYEDLMDRDSYRRRLERFARSERIFPGGDHETGTCSVCARIVAERFGGEIRGYFHVHNEMARIGEAEGGHDFAVTPEGFVVDPWLFHYYGEAPVLDLTVSDDRVEALARYGPEENWQRVSHTPPGRPAQLFKAVITSAAKAG